jgi:hypothetical protein
LAALSESARLAANKRPFARAGARRTSMVSPDFRYRNPFPTNPSREKLLLCEGAEIGGVDSSDNGGYHGCKAVV